MAKIEDPASLLHAPYLDSLNVVVASVYPSGISIWQAERGQKPKEGTYRGRVNGFSMRSRKRLLGKLIQLDYAKGVWLFVTLTYPGSFPADAQRWKMDLDAFHSALRRDWGDIWLGATWRLERQKRGAPHYHLLLALTTRVRLRLLRSWVRKTWTRLLGGPPAHANWVRTKVQEAKIQEDGGIPKLLNYLAKYLAKDDPVPFVDRDTGEILNQGRNWGEWGKLPYAAPTVHHLSVGSMTDLAAGVRLTFTESRYLGGIEPERLRGTFFGSAAIWTELLNGLTWRTTTPVP